MRLIPNIVQLIKKAAVDAVEASKPSCYVYGSVISTNPLKVKIEQKLTLTEDFIIIPERLTDHETELSTDGVTKTTYTIHNALKTGDNLILLQQKGGQRYLVLDRMVSE